MYLKLHIWKSELLRNKLPGLFSTVFIVQLMNTHWGSSQLTISQFENIGSCIVKETREHFGNFWKVFDPDLKTYYRMTNDHNSNKKEDYAYLLLVDNYNLVQMIEVPSNWHCNISDLVLRPDCREPKIHPVDHKTLLTNQECCSLQYHCAPLPDSFIVPYRTGPMLWIVIRH